MTESGLLKKDLFGEIRLSRDGAARQVVRDTGSAHLLVRWLARALLRREARVLAVLTNTPGVPHLVEAGPDRLVRDYIEGRPMHAAGAGHRGGTPLHTRHDSRAADAGRYSAFRTASRLSFASPNSMRVFSLKNSGFCTPA